jgi:hypothetical protein
MAVISIMRWPDREGRRSLWKFSFSQIQRLKYRTVALYFKVSKENPFFLLQYPILKVMYYTVSLIKLCGAKGKKKDALFGKTTKLNFYLSLMSNCSPLYSTQLIVIRWGPEHFEHSCVCRIIEKVRDQPHHSMPNPATHPRGHESTGALTVRRWHNTDETNFISTNINIYFF